MPAPQSVGWTFRPASQRRSKATVERIARATEALLRGTPFEAISVQDIVRGARTTVGSFYARFASKDALLPFLYQRYDRDLERFLAERSAAVAWDALDLEGVALALARVTVEALLERRWLMRALALFARAHPEALPADVYPRRARLHAKVLRAFRLHRRRIAHPDPDAAVLFGVFLVAAAAREQLLFGDAPHARVTAVTSDALTANLAAALIGYLTTRPPTAAA